MRTKKMMKRFENGLVAMAEKPCKILIPMGYIFLILFVYSANSPLINTSINCANPVKMDKLVSTGTSILLLVGIFFIVILIGIPTNKSGLGKISKNSERTECTENYDVTGK